jgi:MFS family permease
MTHTSVDRRSLWRAFAASLSGTSLEWYDFAAYSVASATIFGPLFFPGDDPLASTMLAFSTYAVGYVARPLGGFVFGRLGDVIGRKRVLVITLVLTGTATFLIGLLPTYQSIGGVAAILLVLLRFAQGVGIGGEWGGAVLLSSEFGDPGRRGFWASAAQIGPPAGNLMANGVLALVGALLTDAQFSSWGWRVAFLLSAVLVAFGLWIRLRLEETPVFKAIAAHGDRPEAPVRELFRDEKRALFAGILARVCPDVHYALFTVFVLTYVTQELHMTRGQAMTAVLLGSALQLVTIPAFGAVRPDQPSQAVPGRRDRDRGVAVGVLPDDLRRVGPAADLRRGRGARAALGDVRPAGGVRDRTVLGTVALHRKLHGVHARRRDRRSSGAAVVHGTAEVDRELAGDRRVHRGHGRAHDGRAGART